MSAQNTSLSRRDFVKVTGFAAAALVAAPAAIQAAAPSEALAALSLEDGEYTVDANLRLEAGTLPEIVMSGSAYMTCLNDPNKDEGFPTTKATENATLTVEGNSYKLVLNQSLNACIAWISTGTSTTATAEVTSTADCIYSTDPAKRIDGVSFTLGDLSGSYVFTGGTQYAGFSGWAPLKGSHNWDVTLLVENPVAL